ncbi:class I SAM-dependent methyltransferase [Paenibacillus terreus]|uniref:Class I SAM-dependent methyltransferase n=1 Tax=Paenibacillus terreus TaxID=1387834 RepID=A0ABV5B9X6_9BACL
MDQTIEKEFFEDVEMKINQGQYSEALSTLYDGLGNIRRQYSTEDWTQFIPRYRQHSISHFFLQEPLSRRAFERPRGYAGDPIMLDLQYDYEKLESSPYENEQSEIADFLYYDLNRMAHAINANRERRRILSGKIDQTSERVANPYILSVACGHLRETSDCAAVKNKTIGKFVAIDQDQEALSVAAEAINDFGETIQASVVDIIRNKVPLPTFDFIYSLGVYDYLSDKIAKRLTNKLFQMLNPGGRLLIINYHPGSPTIAYMEAVMDWWLIYRNEDQMQELLEELPKEDIEHVDIFVEDYQTIIFMEIKKAER